MQSPEQMGKHQYQIFYQIFKLQNKKSGFIGTLDCRKNKLLKGETLPH